jgi:hypothetical protein
MRGWIWGSSRRDYQQLSLLRCDTVWYDSTSFADHLVNYSTLEKLCSSETSVDLYQTTPSCIPGNTINRLSKINMALIFVPSLLFYWIVTQNSGTARKVQNSHLQSVKYCFSLAKTGSLKCDSALPQRIAHCGQIHTVILSRWPWKTVHFNCQNYVRVERV